MSFLFAYLDRSRPSACCELCRRDVLSDVLNDEELSLVVRNFYIFLHAREDSGDR